MLNFPRWKIISVILICLLGVILCLPNFFSESVKQKLPSWYANQTFNLGLDLQGGSHLLLSVDNDKYLEDQYEMLADQVRKTLRDEKLGYKSLTSTNDSVKFMVRDVEQLDLIRKAIRKEVPSSIFTDEASSLVVRFNDEYIDALKKKVTSQSMEIVRRRVDETGTKEPIIQQQGSNYILLQVPGLNDPSKLKDLLGQTAKLTFHMVDDNANIEQALAGIINPDSAVLPIEKAQGGFLVVKKKAILSGDMLLDSNTAYQYGTPVVAFKFNDMGGRIFADITRKNIGKLFAVVLDGKIITAPVINSAITGGSGIIEGNFTVESANDLSLLLRAGALPAPLHIVEERTVGPSLGEDSIQAGKIAGLIAVIAITAFMLITYLKFGLFAIIALAVNMILLVAGMSVLNASLTMPGIAGIILTLGMAVDANVLIFERIREETRHGLTPFAAVDQGFHQAFRTITDSNITTLIVAFVLYGFGTGPIKGFAVTLSLGILASMFSAITVTRMMIVIWLKTVKPKVIVI